MREHMYKSVEEFDFIVDSYVALMLHEGRPLSLPGLCLALGFSDKSTLYEYQERDDDWTHSVKRARQLVEAATVEAGYKGNAGMPVFILKNMGYSDRADVNISPVTVKIVGEDAGL